MHNNIDQKLIDILTRQLVQAAVPATRTTPWLVVAPSFHVFATWCHEQKLRHRNHPIEAILVTRPERLRGHTLRDNLVVLGYSQDIRGREMREYVEAMLAVQESKLHV